MSDNKIKPKILIAEDQPITMTLLEDILHDDYTVLSASDGRHALDIVRLEKDIDIILLDIIMPELNGFEVCEELKSDPETKDIPVIILTIMDQEHNEAKGFKLGVADYITKPVSRIKLLTRVKNQLEIRKQRLLLKQKNIELQEALDHIKTLRGILPICSYCKQVRDDEGYWQQVEDYVGGHTDLEFTHSVCPLCMDKHT